MFSRLETCHLCNLHSLINTLGLCDFTNIQVNILCQPEDDGGNMSAMAG